MSVINFWVDAVFSCCSCSWAGSRSCSRSSFPPPRWLRAGRSGAHVRPVARHSVRDPLQPGTGSSRPPDAALELDLLGHRDADPTNPQPSRRGDADDLRGRHAARRPAHHRRGRDPCARLRASATGLMTKLGSCGAGPNRCLRSGRPDASYHVMPRDRGRWSHQCIHCQGRRLGHRREDEIVGHTSGGGSLSPTESSRVSMIPGCPVVRVTKAEVVVSRKTNC